MFEDLHLDHYGLTNLRAVHANLSVPLLVEAAVRRGEGALTRTGALNTRTYARTGRSPNDKLIVREPSSEDQIAWGPVNRPMSVGAFDRLFARVLAYLQNRDVFVFDGFAGADPEYRLSIRVINEFAWHNLFVHQLFLRPTSQELAAFFPNFTIICAPGFRAVPDVDETNSDVFIALNFAKKMVLIGGTHYAGEMKKSIFTVMNYLMPQRGVFPMHCSANEGSDGDVALFFGLSGTGKTTLSTDPRRQLIGDDEHGWSDRGVFNFEGGCYAKCIGLSQETEPQIFAAVRFGSVLENVVVDSATRAPDYDSEAITENTRAAYPVEFIPNADLSGFGGHPTNVIFLTADATGVLPPLARLTTEQAMYHFLSGYTSKLAGTEAGVTEPQATFSACFAAPFLPLAPSVYAHQLGDKLEQHKVACYLVNTGWSGGPYGIGKRISLPYTRKMITAIMENKLKDIEFKPDPVFSVSIPVSCPGVPASVLEPRSAWADKESYEKHAHELVARFRKNFEKFADASAEVKAAGPTGR